jgi:hypothetical protein
MLSDSMTNNWAASVGLACGVALLAACEGSTSRIAYGDVNRIVVVAPDELWEVVQDSVMGVLEPRIFTVRDERTFELTHIAPSDPNYSTLRQFRQVLVLGNAGHSWVEPVLANADATAAPAIVERQDIWARRQLVTALVLPEQGAVPALYAQLPALRDHFDERYRDYVRARMFASEPDTALRRQLAAGAGFSLLLPNLYRMERRADAYVFRTTTEMGSELMRTVTVVSRPGAEPLDAAGALAWRGELAADLYDPPHQTLQRYEARPLTGLPGGVELQGSWSATDEGWPFGGPYVAWAVPCPSQNRSYLVDGWVFAPGRPKYEYMIQLETILASFECAP